MAELVPVRGRTPQPSAAARGVVEGGPHRLLTHAGPRPSPVLFGTCTCPMRLQHQPQATLPTPGSQISLHQPLQP